MIDAHDKADTSHQDVSLGNIILYRDEDGALRVGYLIDWELSRKVDNVPRNTFKLAVCGIFSSCLLLSLTRS